MGYCAIKLDQYGISRWEYYELKAFCRRYDEMITEAEDLLGLHGQDLSGMPKTNMPGHPTEAAAIRRAALLDDIEAIETAARKAGGGAWYDALIESCCRGVAYEKLDQAKMPTSFRNPFFVVRREFFYLLRQLRLNKRL